MQMNNFRGDLSDTLKRDKKGLTGWNPVQDINIPDVIIEPDPYCWNAQLLRPYSPANAMVSDVTSGTYGATGTLSMQSSHAGDSTLPPSLPMDAASIKSRNAERTLRTDVEKGAVSGVCFAISHFVFKIEENAFGILLPQKYLIFTIEMINFRDDLTDTSAKKASLLVICPVLFLRLCKIYNGQRNSLAFKFCVKMRTVRPLSIQTTTFYVSGLKQFQDKVTHNVMSWC